MAHAYYKVTITDHDYSYTTYVSWVDASSKNQAIVKAAAMAGQEKNRREYMRMGRINVLYPGGFLEPDVKLEQITMDEFWEHRNEVEVME